MLQALALYEQALELQPGNKYVQHSLAICHIKAGSLEVLPTSSAAYICFAEISLPEAHL